MLDHHRPAGETLSLAGGPMMAHFLWYLDTSLSPHQLKTKQNKTVVKVELDCPLTKLSRSVHNVRKDSGGSGEVCTYQSQSSPRLSPPVRICSDPYYTSTIFQAPQQAF